MSLYNPHAGCYAFPMFLSGKSPAGRARPAALLGLCLASACLFLCLASGFSSAQELSGDAPRDNAPGREPMSADAQQGIPHDQGKPGFLPWVWQTLTDEANITAGVGVLQSTLTVKRKTDGAQATMVQRDRSTFFLSYSTRPSFFADSSFGYTVMLGYTSFDMTQQETGNHALANLGTEVTGNMVYAVPTLYYQWGEHHYNGTFIRLGAGVGVGAATYTGTTQLTTGEKISTSKKSYTPRLTLTDFLEARWHHIGISISYAAPRIYGDLYDLKVANWSASLGYTYYF